MVPEAAAAERVVEETVMAQRAAVALAEVRMAVVA